MPTNDLYVERFTNGQRHQEFQTDIPNGYVVVLVPGDDHTHIVYGLPEELELAGLKAAPAVEKPKPAPKPRKPAAKKPAAKAAPKKKA